MASAYLYRTLGTPTNAYKGTVSHWIKRSGLGSMGTFAAWDNGGTASNRAYLNLYNDTIYFYDEANSVVVQTNRLLRDTSAWYHIVIAWDTSQGTASDRVKIYVNGVQETSFSTSNYPSQNATLQFNTSGRTFSVGSYASSGSASGFFDGYQSHFAFVDGQQLTPATFGETDSTSGIWKFKPPSGVTWGTNGVHLKFENSGALGTDSSGNSNTFTVNGNLKQSLDTPSNNHCTLNPNDVMKQSGGILNPIYSNGNLTMSTDANTNTSAFGSLSPETGKWYWEFKVDVANTTGHRLGIFFSNDKTHGGSYYYGTDGFIIHQNGQIYYNGSSTTYMASYTAGDIISVALDITNGNIYMSKNGGASDSTWADGSGNNNQAFPGTSINGKLSVSWPAAGTPIQPYFDVYGTNNKQSINFGDGFFGTTAITSAGSNGNGSLFEYDVPSGYYALNTKNINTYG